MVFKEEKIKIINIPIKIYIKCLKKKKQLFVSNLSEAISDVETNEKKSPIANNELISKKIDLSILFHH